MCTGGDCSVERGADRQRAGGGVGQSRAGQSDEVPDFQLALAHNGQSRRLHATNPDDSPRALPKNDGRGARK